MQYIYGKSLLLLVVVATVLQISQTLAKPMEEKQRVLKKRFGGAPIVDKDFDSGDDRKLVDQLQDSVDGIPGTGNINLADGEDTSSDSSSSDSSSDSSSSDSSSDSSSSESGGSDEN